MTTRYQRHHAIRLTDLAGEGVVLHLGSRSYFTVTETGLVILEALKQPRTFDELVAAGSMSEARAKGKVRMEGKEYVMQDGDVVEFRFNV